MGWAVGGGGGVDVGSVEGRVVGEGLLGFDPGGVGEGVVLATTVLVAVGATAPAGTHNSWPMLRTMLVRQLTSWRYSTGMPPAAAILESASLA